MLEVSLFIMYKHEHLDSSISVFAVFRQLEAQHLFYTNYYTTTNFFFSEFHSFIILIYFLN